jgi:phosphoribosylformylglycinamidine synthase
MDLKTAGNLLYLIGTTHEELGGSHFALVNGLSGGRVPRVDAMLARKSFAALHRAISGGLVRACHDLSEGGLAVAAAEMAFAGGLGARIDLDRVPSTPGDLPAAVLLFSESNSRFLCEVPPASAAEFESRFAGVPHARVGEVTAQAELVISRAGRMVLAAEIAGLKAAWQAPLDWT